MSTPKREPVDYLFQGLNWDFIAAMSRICLYATEKYGSFDQYMDGQLEGEKAPINHAFNHLREYVKGIPHDHSGTRADQLLAVAYNVMMEWEYERRGMGLELNKVNSRINSKLDKLDLWPDLSKLIPKVVKHSSDHITVPFRGNDWPIRIAHKETKQVYLLESFDPNGNANYARTGSSDKVELRYEWIFGSRPYYEPV